MSWSEIVLANLIVFVGSVLQGSIGFGMGLFASPILILIDPRFVPAPVLLSTMVLTALLTYREWGAIDFPGILWTVIGRIGGTAAAAAVLLVVSADHLVLLFGFLILFGVAMSISGVRFVPVRWVLIAVGLLSGIMGTIASIGGPPMALVYQNVQGARIRSTMSAFFLIGTVASLAALRLVGRFGEYEVRLALIILPSLLAGYVASRWTVGVIDRGYTRPIVLVVSAAAGALVIARQLF